MRAPRAVSWIVDDSMRCFGEADTELQVVKINLKLHRESKECLLDTFIHEHLHIKFPRMPEKQVKKITECFLSFLTPAARVELRQRYLRRLNR
jgi:hypothetical protein